MKLEDFNQLELKTIGSAPLGVKVVLLSLIFILIVGSGYWFLWKPALEELEQAENKETELRNVFLVKKKEAINLPIYKQQMADIEKTFGTLLRQLPDMTQMDALLNDINQAGLEVGLEFQLFKPEAERRIEFYAERPISMRVTGTYHQLGAFAQNISKLSRIVSLNDMSIMRGGNKESELVATSLVAKTYRYLDADESAPQGKKAQGKKK